MVEGKRPDLRIGTSGWSYDDWHGTFYPPGRPAGFDALTYVARFFNAVEVNSSFYRPPTSRMTESWVRRTPDDFLFTAKLWRRFTHERQAPPSGREIDIFRRGIAPLADAGKLGGLLAQFPWSFKAEPESMDHLAMLARAFEGTKLFLEVRHASWLAEEAQEDIRSLRYLWTNIDQPVIGESIPRTTIATGREAYVRIHGRNYESWFAGMGKGADLDEPPGGDAERRNERYNYLYTADEVEEIASDVEKLLAEVDRLYLFANNHFQGKAAANAIELSARLTGERPEAPDVLADVYPIIKRVATPVPVVPKRKRKPGTGELF